VLLILGVLAVVVSLMPSPPLTHPLAMFGIGFVFVLIAILTIRIRD
jgi:hypothetical protein